MAMTTFDDTDIDLTLYFQSNEKSDIMPTIDNIGHIIDCLLRLSITIQNPAPHDQFVSRAGADTVSTYKEWDMRYIREKFSSLDDRLVDRLGTALSRRRQYLKYREEHSEKLANGLINEADEGDNATTIASSIPKMLKDMENAEQFPEMDTLFDNVSEISGTSYANSNAATNELRVPNIPKEYINGPFQCPYCRALILIEDRSSWKKHVFRDLQPYICLFDNCLSPNQLYQRRKDWVAHMKQEHWISWSCSFGCSGSFDSQEPFKAHLTTVHGQSFESIDLQAVANLCRFPNDSNVVSMCPFCSEYQIRSGKSYQSHVGDHLERLALFVLPQTEYNDSDDDDDDDDDDDRNDNDNHDNYDSYIHPEEDDGNSDHHQESRRDGNEELDEGNIRSNEGFVREEPRPRPRHRRNYSETLVNAGFAMIGKRKKRSGPIVLRQRAWRQPKRLPSSRPALPEVHFD
ncbi:hypothetical protein J3F84DRAFT_308048 [Trichoderma pleuroticola]